MNTTESNQLIDELSVAVDPATFIEEIDGTELPSVVSSFSQQYDNEGIGNRDEFLWKWIYQVLDHLTLEIVPDDRLEETKAVKTLFSMFITILDDLAEDDRDRETFKQVRTIPVPIALADSSAGVDQSVLSIEKELWAAVIERLAAMPVYEEYKPLFTYDTRQVINAMDYSQLINESPDVATTSGINHYDLHNMCAFPYMNIDLMAATGFDRRDLAPVRELYWDAQQMARIGNWVSTWKRELREGDYASGVVVKALRDGIISVEQAQTDPGAAIEAIEASSIEEEFIEQWHTLHTALQTVDETATSIDLDRVANRMEITMAFQLAAEGYK